MQSSLETDWKQMGGTSITDTEKCSKNHRLLQIISKILLVRAELDLDCMKEKWWPKISHSEIHLCIISFARSKVVVMAHLKILRPEDNSIQKRKEEFGKCLAGERARPLLKL
jgi:hypothetical protein